ncbi:MAG: glucose-6-phosphate dehydrogenase assembly protein OpcA [Gemmataceae bacterium]|nr:glucose-6-phosphate dehydrogenase assembly protein OpcA [Gemmataceae bacterium]
MSDTVVGPRHKVLMREVERELTRQMRALQGQGGALQRARMSNLVVFTDSLERSIEANEQLVDIARVHPSRAILLVAEPGKDRELTARVTVRPLAHGSKRYALSEMVTLHAGGSMAERLPFAVRSLLIGDLPVNLWWSAPTPPPLAGPLLYDLAEHAQQIVYDSIGWPEPARGVVATASWLESVERRGADWRVASDLNWRRLKYWRRLLLQALEPMSAPGAKESVREVAVEHGPHASVQAWLLASWLVRFLGGRVRAGKATGGKEMAWSCQMPNGEVLVRIRRLDDGPPSVRRVRVATAAGTLALSQDGPNRLAVETEGSGTAARTVTTAGMGAMDLIGRQLSDRERDPAFHESMALAGTMAQGLLG